MSEDLERHTTVAVAGSQRGGVAGWGACVLVGGAVSAVAAGAASGRTPFRAELLAVQAGLAAAPREGAVILVTANANISRVGGELERWRQSGWQGRAKALEHRDVLERIGEQVSRLRVEWQCDPGHQALGRARDLARHVAARVESVEVQVQVPVEVEVEVEVPPPPADVTAPQLAHTVPRLLAYTDGGCRGNPGLGGWGFLLMDRASGHTLERRGGERETTNNRMELTAAIQVLEAIRGNGQEVEIRTDSKYLKDMAEKWITGWKRRGWRRQGGAIKNLDLVKMLDSLQERHQVTWRWVRGHSGEPGNEAADKLTNDAMDAIARGADPGSERRYRGEPARFDARGLPGGPPG